jgi:hypothetical protein
MQNMHSKTLALLIFITFTIFATHSQNICSNCISVTNMTSNFTCNNIFCQGFSIPYDNQYNFNSSSVMCNQANGANGGSNCFYLSTTTINVSVTYIFCNVSIVGCASCSNQSVCTTCFYGYYLYMVNASVTNCQVCNQSLSGCLYCSNQGTCTQCYPGYALFGSLCANLDGKLPKGLGFFTYEKGGSTVAEIVGAVFIFGILVIVLIAVGIFFCKEKKKVPDFLNPNLCHTSME